MKNDILTTVLIKSEINKDLWDITFVIEYDSFIQTRTAMSMVATPPH